MGQIGIIEGEFHAGGYIGVGTMVTIGMKSDAADRIIMRSATTHNGFLFCDGKIVDEIDGVGAMSRADIESGAVTINSEHEIAIIHQPRTARLEADGSPSGVGEVYKVLVAGCDSNGRPAPTSFSCLYSAFTQAEPPNTSALYRNWHFINSSADLMINGYSLASYFDHLATNADRPPRSTPSRRSMLDIAAASQAMTACTRMRKLIITTSGLLGLAPAQTLPDDAVIVVKGYGKPVIARRRQDDRQDLWHLIGEAYIPGMMNAEKLPMDGNYWNYEETRSAAETLQQIIFVGSEDCWNLS